MLKSFLRLANLTGAAGLLLCAPVTADDSFAASTPSTSTLVDEAK